MRNCRSATRRGRIVPTLELVKKSFAVSITKTAAATTAADFVTAELLNRHREQPVRNKLNLNRHSDGYQMYWSDWLMKVAFVQVM